MRQIADRPPIVTFKGHPPYSAARMTSTLAAHYERKRRILGTEFQGYYDDSLRDLFAADRAVHSGRKASRLCALSGRLVNIVTRWTGHSKFDIFQLVNRLAARCEALGLSADGGAKRP
jgi:hypothetical protein